MSYLKRLREASFIAPTGDEIKFFVNTLERSGGKKGATQEILDSGESISQDQGNMVTTFPVNAYFTGENYDLLTDIFYQALELQYTPEDPGILIHPRWGDIPVFPFVWSQTEELIDGAGIGRIDVIFRRVFPRGYPTTDARSLSDALANLELLEIETIELAGGFDFSTFQAIANMAGNIRDAIGTISNALATIASTIQAVTDTMEAIQSEINGLIDDIAGNIFEIMAATQRLIRAPGRIIDQTLSKINAYSDMITAICNNLLDENETSPVNNRNNALTMQLIGGFSVAAAAEAAAFTKFTERSKSVNAIDLINSSAETFNTLFEQSRTSGDVTKEYSGDHNFFILADDTVKRINEIILNQAFDLKAEKRFILKHNSDIITLCYENYKSVSNEDIQFFVETNRFIDEEYIEIPAGREIVIYG